MKQSDRLILEKSNLVFLILIFSFALNYSGKTQENPYWQGLSLVNPAIIGSPVDWLYGGYHFSNYDNVISGFNTGVDYEVNPKFGTLGFDLSREEISTQTTTLGQINYAYTLQIKEVGKLSLGVSSGIMSYKFDLSNYLLYPDAEPDPSFSGSLIQKSIRLKTSLGLFYTSGKFDLGTSYFRFDKLKDETDNDVVEPTNTKGNLSLLGAYRFEVAGKLIIEPNILFSYSDKETQTNTGIFFTYNKRLWAGYSNLNLDDLHSIMIGSDIKGKYRIGYSYNFTRLFDRDSLNLHEFLIAIRIR